MLKKDFFMQKSRLFRKFISLIVVLAILCSTVFSLSSCFSSFRKEEDRDGILENISETVKNDRKNYDNVTPYLSDWGLPKFDTQKLSWVEGIFQQFYNIKGGLPDTLDHAVLTANHFLDNYYGKIDHSDKETVTDAIITSYVEVIGDPYSVYRTPDENEEYGQDISGTFGGIGVTVEYDHQNKTIMVVAVHIGSPSEAAGMKVGDYIVGVNGKTVEEVGYDKMVNHIRGKVGTPVTVTVLRGDKKLDLTMTREIVTDQTVTYSLDEDGIGYIRVTEFKEITHKQFTEAVDFMLENDAKGIVFDVRSNPGGLLETVVDMMSYILPTGKTVLSYQYKGQPTVKRLTEKDKTDKNGKAVDVVVDLPMVVLCNEYSASAAEIFTSVIRDYRNEGLLNATIVGTTTYKKGIMQASFQYTKDSSLITLTVAYYNPPSGENYHGIGITPDVYVELPDTPSDDGTIEDTQLAKGIEELKKLINANNILQ